MLKINEVLWSYSKGKEVTFGGKWRSGYYLLPSTVLGRIGLAITRFGSAENMLDMTA